MPFGLKEPVSFQEFNSSDPSSNPVSWQWTLRRGRPLLFSLRRARDWSGLLLEPEAALWLASNCHGLCWLSPPARKISAAGCGPSRRVNLGSHRACSRHDVGRSCSLSNRSRTNDGKVLAPDPIPGAFLVPLGRWLKVACPGHEMLPHDVLVESHSEARPIGHLNPPVVHDRR